MTLYYTHLTMTRPTCSSTTQYSNTPDKWCKTIKSPSQPLNKETKRIRQLLTSLFKHFFV